MINSELLGTVVAVQANFYQVRLQQPVESIDLTSSPADSLYCLCTRRTRLKKIGQTVMVGDRVWVEELDWLERRGAIADVLPRQTELERPPVANVDQIMLVFALEEPSLDPWQLSRFLVKAESTDLALCLCLNKSDLVASEQQQQWQTRLQEWGYFPLFVSVARQQNLELLTDHLNNQITVVAGPSGVGKSSLINRLIPSVDLRVGRVSGKLQRGRHTTRHVELFELPGGGLLADSPGFNQPYLNCQPADLINYFPEGKKRLTAGNCQFSNCLHRDEPNCVVRGDWERYEYYLKFLEEAIAHQTELQKTPVPESTLKVKVKQKGQQEYEPKLETKKYRRSSRKQSRQNLQEMYENQSLDDIYYEIEE